MEISVRAVDSGPFSGVAKQPRIGQPVVLKAIPHLEDRPSIRQLMRSAHDPTATAVGRSLSFGPFSTFPPKRLLKETLSVGGCALRHPDRSGRAGWRSRHTKGADFSRLAPSDDRGGSLAHAWPPKSPTLRHRNTAAATPQIKTSARPTTTNRDTYPNVCRMEALNASRVSSARLNDTISNSQKV
jgi:hypothetical protein